MLRTNIIVKKSYLKESNGCFKQKWYHFHEVIQQLDGYFYVWYFDNIPFISNTLIYPSIYSLTHSFIHSFSHWPIHSFIYPSIQLFIDISIHYFYLFLDSSPISQTESLFGEPLSCSYLLWHKHCDPDSKNHGSVDDITPLALRSSFGNKTPYLLNWVKCSTYWLVKHSSFCVTLLGKTPYLLNWVKCPTYWLVKHSSFCVTLLGKTPYLLNWVKCSTYWVGKTFFFLCLVKHCSYFIG